MTGTARWVLKKGLRLGVAISSATPAIAFSRGQGALRALTYHRFVGDRHDPFSIEGGLFEAQMAWLAHSGHAAEAKAVAAWQDGNGPIPNGIIVTIDDGYLSTIAVAAPILRKYALPALAFIIAGRIGTAPADKPERYMDRDEILALSDYGITVGSHSLTHRSLAALPDAELAKDLEASKDLLQNLCNRSVNSFAYPFGTRRDFSSRTRDAVSKAGYRVAFTSQHGAIGNGSDMLALPRIKMEGGEGRLMIALAARGGLDPWRWIDRWGARFQASAAGALPVIGRR